MYSLAFDLGNVVFGFNYTFALEKIRGKMGASVAKVIEEFYINDFTLPFEKGLVSGRQFYQKFKNTFSASFSYSEFVDIWCKIFFPIPEIVKLVEKLKKDYSIYLISNINELHFDYLYQEYPHIFSLFDDLILSFKIKSVKPELKIYEVLKVAAKEEFKNIIYIDDRPDLIEAAKQFGLLSIRFTGYSNLIDELKKFNIVVR